MITEEEAINKTKSKHSKRLEYIDEAKIKLISETVFGKEYFRITLPVNENGKKRNKSSLPYISLIEKSNGEFHYSRKKHLSQVIRERVFKIYLPPYLIIFLLISIGSYYSVTFLLLMYCIPILFSYMIFSISYTEMGDYLKKISDFVLVLTAGIGATLLIFQFIDTSKITTKSTLYTISSFVNDYQNIILSIRVFLGEIFIFFYITKLQIAFSEMVEARNEYKKENQLDMEIKKSKVSTKPNKVIQKTKNLIRKFKQTPISLTKICVKIKSLF
ncbi:hypothetical protein NB716_000367 [Pantoea ananatis]|uniref:hypothetical protein n=1 Tax=Pantoea ananas TaxID=553 RepID=UPI0021F72E7E|nr:hypothetical protein [Pantoea ananatis]MCW0351573.1 hypothetical protein [Pantoea ananatis]